MFKFITNRPFWVNLLAAIGIALLFLFLFLKMLGWITKHGAYLKVPAVTGMKTTDALKLLEKQGFEVYIQDSVFTDTAARGVVLKQLPDPNATVKINRTVFITVNRLVPPMIEMPRLEDQGLSFALTLLERNHLKLEDTVYKQDFRKGTVIEQLYKGKRIPEKTKIQWGSAITLVIGAGTGDEQMVVPSLTGLSLEEAKAIMEASQISLGAIIIDGKITDTSSAYVFKQNPETRDGEGAPNYIKSGQVIDLWISQAMKYPTDSVTINKKNQLP